MKLSDIAGGLGIVPALLKKAYDKEQDKMDALKAENASLRDSQAQEGRLVGMKKGGKVKASSASKRADGIAQRGKTRGRII